MAKKTSRAKARSGRAAQSVNEDLEGALESELRADQEAAQVARDEGIVVDEPSQEELAAGRRNPQLDALKALDAIPAEDDEDAPRRRQIVRPSQVSALIEKWAEEQQLDASQVDRFRFCRERGIPAPQRRYRITGVMGTKDGPVPFPPTEIDAVSESEAFRQALDKRKQPGKIRHKWQLRAAVIAE